MLHNNSTFFLPLTLENWNDKEQKTSRSQLYRVFTIITTKDDIWSYFLRTIL